MATNPPRIVPYPALCAVYLEAYFGNTFLSSATGLVIANPRPHLITNRHVVTGRHNDTNELLSKRTGAVPDRISVMHLLDRTPTQPPEYIEWASRSAPLFRDETPLWREHPTLGRNADLVAVPLVNLDGIQVPDLIRSSTEEIRIEETDVVSVVGFPFGLNAGGSIAVFATGFLASSIFSELPTFLIDCRSRPGQSGSPVLAYRNAGTPVPTTPGTTTYSGPVWRFLGIYSGRVHPDSDLGIVWKASVLKELIVSL